MPDSAADAELLAGALKALNQHADVLRELGVVFADAGHELYLVGGSVRDALLGRLGNDLDFTTDARPEQMYSMLRGWADALWDTGIEFGTVGVGKSGHRMEITTFRADATTRSRAIRRCDSESASTTTWCAATSPSTRWRCASPPTARANSMIP